MARTTGNGHRPAGARGRAARTRIRQWTTVGVLVVCAVGAGLIWRGGSASRAAQTQVEAQPAVRTLHVEAVRTVPHARDAYTQGLAW